MDTPILSVVAPCFNEAQGLEEFCRRVSAVCATVAGPPARGGGYEIVLVNDGSTDATWRVMTGLAQRIPGLACVSLSRNHGHQLALTAGLSLCRGQRVLILDADLQDPPELLPQMMAVMDGGADVVYGQRRRRNGETAFKRASASVFYRIVTRLAETRIPRDTGDFRLISRRALDIFLSMPERHRFVRGMVSWIGFRQEPILYDREARFAGDTKYPLRKMFRFALDAVTSFSIRPLAWASHLGVLSTLLALGLLIYALVGYVTGRTAAGWASLMATITLLSGVQLFMLGIFGEYLGRLCDQAKGRPLFIVDQIVRGQIESEPPVVVLPRSLEPSRRPVRAAEAEARVAGAPGHG
jgi:dolichol-phosphate mannosyltransferase